jgi:putative transcriptional regulator
MTARHSKATLSLIRIKAISFAARAVFAKPEWAFPVPELEKAEVAASSICTSQTSKQSSSSQFMQKPKNRTSAKPKKTNSVSSRRKFAVRSALGKLEPFTGPGLIAAATEGLAALKEKKTLRTHRISSPPSLDPAQITQIRSTLNASQAVFAGYLGVSKAAVVAWEYGTRQPSGAARRLLSIAQKKPELLVTP